MIDQAQRLRQMARSNVGVTAFKSTARPAIIAAASGKGGVGKTNIAANLGILLSSRGVRTAILDADLGLSNVEVLLGCTARYNLGDVIGSGLSIAQACAQGPAGVKVISAGSGVEWLANLTSSQRQDIISMLTASDLDIKALVIDTGPGISDNVIDFLAMADEVLVVTTPEPTAILDSYALIKTMFSAGHNSRVELIVNAVPNKRAAEAAAMSIDSICHKFLGRSIDSWCWIPYDPNLRTAVSRQQPIVELYPTSRMSRQLRNTALGIVSRIHSRNRMVAR